MQKKLITITIVFLSFFILSCEKKKIEKIEVGKMKTYTDPLYKFSINYPTQWKQMGEVGNAKFYQSNEVANNFLDPVNGDRIGAEISVITKIIDSVNTLERISEELENDVLVTERSKIIKEEKFNIKEYNGKKIDFEIPVTNKISIHGYQITFQVDTQFYAIRCRAFGDDYESNQDLFTAITSSFTAPKILPKGDIRPRPSENFSNYETEFFSIQYPDNFNFSKQNQSEKNLSMELKGQRLDCTIQIDVENAKDLNLEKAFIQKSAAYKSNSNGETQINGEQAKYVNYSMRKDSKSKSYFFVKNDKIIKVTFNWYKPDEDIYSSIFERVIQSIKLK